MLAAAAAALALSALSPQPPLGLASPHAALLPVRSPLRFASPARPPLRFASPLPHARACCRLSAADVDEADADDERRDVDGALLRIAAPALVGLAVEPVASLVDTAAIGRCCAPAALAGAGVGIALLDLVSRTFNFLLAATTTLVAENAPADGERGAFTQPMARAVSASLVVALFSGVAIALTIGLNAGRILSGPLGIGPASALYGPARAYLRLRAAAAPAALCSMVLIGAFRGAKDTSTPLAALATATVLNVALDAIMVPARLGGVRLLGWGAAGAAAATAAALYVECGALLRAMLRRCADDCVTAPGPLGVRWLPQPRRAEVSRVARAGSALTVRSFTNTAAMSYAAISASRIGAAAGAAHQVRPSPRENLCDV